MLLSELNDWEPMVPMYTESLWKHRATANALTKAQQFRLNQARAQDTKALKIAVREDLEPKLKRFYSEFNVSSGFVAEMVQGHINRQEWIRQHRIESLVNSEFTVTIDANTSSDAISTARRLMHYSLEIICISDDKLRPILRSGIKDYSLLYHYLDATVKGGVENGVNIKDFMSSNGSSVKGSAKATKIIQKAIKIIKAKEKQYRELKEAGYSVEASIEDRRVYTHYFASSDIPVISGEAISSYSYGASGDLEDMYKDYLEFLGSGNKAEEHTFVITGDVMEMLGATENCGYSSCFRIHGEYHQGAIGAARSASTFMLYEKTKAPRESYVKYTEKTGVTHKRARAWLHMATDDKGIAGIRVPTVYSDSIDSSVENRSKIAWALEEHLVSLGIWEKNESRKGSISSRIRMSFDNNFYEDSGTTITREPNTEYTVVIEAGLDLASGGEMYSGEIEGTCCSDCGDQCGSRDNMFYIDSTDEYVCDSCIDNYRYCDYYDRYYPEEECVYVEGYGHVSEDAIENSNNFGYAESRGEYYVIEPLVETGDGVLEHEEDCIYSDYDDTHYLLDEVVELEVEGDVIYVYNDKIDEAREYYGLNEEEEE